MANSLCEKSQLLALKKKSANRKVRSADRLEQDTGLEPAAYCLGSSRSTG